MKPENQTENLALKGCCPIGHSCYEDTGNKLNYYPGDCPDWHICAAVVDTVNAFDNSTETKLKKNETR